MGIWWLSRGGFLGRLPLQQKLIHQAWGALIVLSSAKDHSTNAGWCRALGELISTLTGSLPIIDFLLFSVPELHACSISLLGQNRCSIFRFGGRLAQVLQGIEKVPCKSGHGCKKMW